MNAVHPVGELTLEDWVVLGNLQDLPEDVVIELICCHQETETDHVAHDGLIVLLISSELLLAKFPEDRRLEKSHEEGEENYIDD